jgi:integrase
MPPDLVKFVKQQPVGLIVRTQLHVRTIKEYFTEIGRSTDIKVSEKKFATLHDFRRTFGHRWALKVHPMVLRHLMRHQDIQTTLKYYVSLEVKDVASQIWKE